MFRRWSKLVFLPKRTVNRRVARTCRIGRAMRAHRVPGARVAIAITEFTKTDIPTHSYRTLRSDRIGFVAVPNDITITMHRPSPPTRCAPVNVLACARASEPVSDRRDVENEDDIDRNMADRLSCDHRPDFHTGHAALLSYLWLCVVARLPPVPHY